MRIVATGSETFILLNGVVVSHDVRLSDSVQLQPADTSHLDLQTAISACSSADDIAVVAAYIPRTTAQVRISASTPQELVATAWNVSWFMLLLSAYLHTEVGFNIQCDVPADAIGAKTTLRATNHFMHGLVNARPHVLTSEESDWVATHFVDASQLLDHDRFQAAVHCLASYRWHSMPSVQLAILWAGIEGMFGASSEIRFRISLYIARFLHPDDPEARRGRFDSVKRLYTVRSAAVHGSRIKGDARSAVTDSAMILRDLLIKCVAIKAMPEESELVP